ncbi:hypothetical protein AHAS_Ahas16G0034800 [Arachis hypogaea]
MALEKFYNEHKYPTEEMKQDLAEELGLTEKQISGWFCHISGRQDSCGSSKHGDYRYVDPKEVESHDKCFACFSERVAIDFDPNSLRNILPKAVSSLEWAISKGKGRVYVHCTAGLGRAPGVTIAYLF